MDEKPICRKCQLYDPKSRLCGVIIPLTLEMQSELGVKMDKIQLKPSPNDPCFFEQEFRAINKDKMEIERFKIEVQQIKMWVEDPKSGAKGKEGVVKMEYPAGSYLDALLRQEEENEKDQDE